MSEKALQIYEEAHQSQLNSIIARRIRTRVSEAQQNPYPATIRWPFELLQNALDVGPRKSHSSVRIRLCRESSKVVFEHNGAPFTSKELSALLSGGSSKEFESEETTGRFGTGFLVTHVLAERTRLQGLLEVESGYEQFDLILDRGGDENTILENIYSCNEAIRNAKPVERIEEIPSAHFEYTIQDNSIFINGLEALRESLPYLYLTRKSLGRIEFETKEYGEEIWSADNIIRTPFENGYVEYRSIHIQSNGTMLPEIRAFRYTVGQNSTALMLLEKVEAGWKVKLPKFDEPHIYREYPLRGSTFLPINFVLDGKFDPDQERSKLLMNDNDKHLLEDAFTACVLGVKYAFDQQWEGAHLLTRASKPISTFDVTNNEEIKWWDNHLTKFAEQLARLPIVKCRDRYLPAITENGAYADFIIPSLLPDSIENETTIERLWPLVEAATELCPAQLNLVLDWTEMALGWKSLGLPLNFISVSKLAEYARGEAKTIDQLKIKGDPIEWLARFLDIVGECWSNRKGIDLAVVMGILPNQKHRLCSPKELRRDNGISEELKAICDKIDYDIRSQLFLRDFTHLAEALELKYLPKAVEDIIQIAMTEDEVITESVKYLGNIFPENKDCDETTSRQQKASVALLHYLWETQKEVGFSTASQIPLITLEKRAVRWSQNRRMMAPISNWQESARPFAKAYPPSRILMNLYSGNETEQIPTSVPELVKWGMIYQDPLLIFRFPEVKDSRLAVISSDDTSGVVITNEKFSYVALLNPDMLNRCQEGIEEARALLGLILCHVARNDRTWQEKRLVKGRKAGKDVEIEVQGTLWLADLKNRAWVPMRGEDGKFVKVHANATTLKGLLDPAWLDKNEAAIKLLSEWFGFDELELRLLGTSPNEENRQELRNELARLLESGGADPEFYRALSEEIEAKHRKSRDVNRCRQFGLAIQDAIKSALESYRLKLKLVDRGFDYTVEQATGDVLEDGATKCEIGQYLLEIKATTTGAARLTPLQAQTASAEASRYILCVVDLRNISGERLDEEWTASDVEPLAKIVSSISSNVEETYLLVEEARSNSVSIRNDAALRYEVPLSVWGTGISISEWVKSISNQLTESISE